MSETHSNTNVKEVKRKHTREKRHFIFHLLCNSHRIKILMVYLLLNLLHLYLNKQREGEGGWNTSKLNKLN